LGLGEIQTFVLDFCTGLSSFHILGMDSCVCLATNLENCEFSEIENVQFDSIVKPCISQVGKDITCSNRDDGTEQKIA
jgi:hypothetical protein